MAINKNFVIKNGIQANDNLFVADSDNNKVGIKTAIPDYDFHVIGGIGATHALVTGVTTTSGLLDINGGGQANTFKVEDLTDNRIVIAGTGGELEDSGNLTFDGTTLGLTGSQTISGDIDVDGHTDLDDLIVAGVSTFSANIDANGDVNVGGALSVTGNSYFVGMVTFAGGTNGEIVLGDSAGDNVVFNADVNSHFLPNTDDTYDLGSSSQEWKDLYLDGTANIDSLVADTADIDGGTIDGATIGGATPAAGTFTNLVANGNVDLGDATSDTITATGRFDSDLVPSTNGARDLGSSTLEWKDLYLDGTANIDSLVADTADIDGGTIDGATIGGATPAAGTFTNLVANGNVDLGDATSDTITATGRFDSDLVPSTNGARDLGSSTLEWKDLYLDGTANIDSLVADTADIDGGTIDGATIGANSASTGAFTTLSASSNVTITGNLDVDGRTDLDDLVIAGVSTFSANVDINSHVDVVGGIDADHINTTGVSTFQGGSIDIANAVRHIGDPDTTIAFPSADTVKIETNGSDRLIIGPTGVSTFSGAIDADGDLDVDGHTDLDDLVVAGVSTFLDAAVFNSTGSIQIPAGTTGQRLSPAAVGQIRYNTQLSQFEGYGAGNAWGSLGGVKDVDGDTFIRAESAAGEDEDTLEFLTADATRVTINAAGRVGIGSTLPTTNLDVDGTGAISGDLTVVGVVTSTTFIGNLTGNVTGNTSGSAGSLAAGATGVDLTLSGDLTVNGTTTTINSTTVSVDDKNIELGSTASPSDTSADGGGITLKGTSDHTFNWVNSTDAWTSSEHLDLASSKGYMLNGTTVLSGTTLGSTIVTSSLTALGTITTGVWNGTAIDNAYLANSTMSVGGVTLTLGATDATPAFDLSDATNYPTTSLTGTITNAQLAGSIADSKLSTISTADKVSISALNIDGGTDIGAALADADLFIVDDGGGGTNRYTAASRIKSYIADVTLTTAAQTNITSVGTLTGLTVSGDITAGNAVTSSSSVDGSTRYSNGTFYLSRGGTNNLIVGRQTGTSGNTVEINADGSATFNGGVLSKRANGTEAAFAARTTSASDNAIELNADGSATFAGDIAIADTIVHDGDTNTKIRFPAADTFTVETAGTERLRVTSDGKVGINSTSPTADLEVAGTTGTASTVFINAPSHSSSTASEAVLKFGYAHSGSPGAVAEIKLVEGSTNSFGGHLTFSVPDNNGSGGSSTSEALRITSGGNIGIGTNNPSQKVHIQDSSGPLLTFDDATTQFGHVGSYRTLVGSGNIDTFLVTSANSKPLVVRAPSGQTISFDIASNNAMTIDSSQRLLVGTDTSPTAGGGAIAKSVIQGNTSNSAGAGYLSLQRGQAAASINSGETLGLINFADSAGNDYAIIKGRTGEAGGSGDYPGELVFGTAADGASTTTDHLFITSAGQMGLGMTPGKLLDLQAASGLAMRYYNGATFRAGLEVATNAGDMVSSSSAGDFCIRSQSNLLVSAGGDTERLRVTSNGQILSGIVTARGNLANNASGVEAQVQIEGTSFTSSTLSIIRNSANADDGGIIIGKTRSASTYGNAAVIAGDDLGSLIWAGSDGTSLQFGAEILAEVQSGVGNDDLPTDLIFKTNGGTTDTTERLRVNSGGNVLVGTSTSRIVEDHVGNGPQGLIQIESTDSAAIMSIISAGTADANRCGTISLGRHRGGIGDTPTIVQDNDALGAIVFAGGDGNDMRSSGAKIHAEVDGTPGQDDMPGALVFSTTPDGSSSPYQQERLRITSGGKIGINATSPGGVLDVQGGADDLVRFQSVAGAISQRLVSANGSLSNIEFSDSSAFRGKIQAETDDSLTFYTGGVSSEKVRITSGGNFGLGETSPDFKFHSKETGGSSIAGLFETNQTDAFISFQASGTTASSTVRIGAKGDDFVAYVNGGYRLYIKSNGDIERPKSLSQEVSTSVSSVSATSCGSFAKATYRSAYVVAQITQGSSYQVGRYLLIHDGTTVTTIEESAIATGSMLGTFEGVINGSNVEFRVTMGSASSATVITKIESIVV